MSLIELIEKHIKEANLPREKIITIWVSNKYTEQDYEVVRNTFKGVELILTEYHKIEENTIQWKK